MGMSEQFMNLKPNADRILIRPWDASKELGSTLHIPKTSKTSKPTVCHGQVVAVGPGTYLSNGDKMPMIAKVGDTILYDPRSGVEWRHASNLCYLWLHDSQVIAYIKQKVGQGLEVTPAVSVSGAQA